MQAAVEFTVAHEYEMDDSITSHSHNEIHLFLKHPLKLTKIKEAT